MMRKPINTDILEKRYFQNGETTWDDVVRRVAGHAAGKDEARYNEFFQAIYSGKFFPSRMTYMGTDNAFASSCFVFPVEDDLSAIMQTLSEACQVQKFGGGTGYNFSHLRPKGDLIKTSGGQASGPVSFMSLFHSTMEVVHRAGKKHAAQMGILNCDHPDIFDFIQCKDIEGAFWTFNISVGITDAFMQAVKDNTDWDLLFKGKVYKTIRARDLWNYIVQHAWYNGDPGVIFLDTVSRYNCYPEPVDASNPCGEQMLPPHVSCNLGSIDLSRFVVGGKVDWKELAETVKIGVRFLDGSIEHAFWPVEKIREKTHRYRNIGLGVMGWADMLILLGFAYDSQEAVQLAEQVMEFVSDTAREESTRLGNGKQRNITLTSIAPTGSISFLAGCSSGIEPLFGIATTRNTYVGSFQNVHWIFEHIAHERGFYSEQLMGEIARSGSVQGIAAVPDDVKRIFKTAMEIGWEWHIAHQAGFQKYTDNAVSKSINLPNSATVQDVRKAYKMAYTTECKSTTVYRDGSRTVQVLENSSVAKRDMCPNCKAILFMRDGVLSCVTCGYVPTGNAAEPKANKVIRPNVLSGQTYKKDTPTGTAYVTINSNGGGTDDPFEVFLIVGKAGSDVFAVSEALGRTISLALRMPSPIGRKERLAWIANELIGIGGGRSLGFGPNRVKSLPDGVAQVFQEYLLVETAAQSIGDLCPDCGEATLLHVEGCAKCLSCGYSEC